MITTNKQLTREMTYFISAKINEILKKERKEEKKKSEGERTRQGKAEKNQWEAREEDDRWGDDEESNSSGCGGVHSLEGRC